MPLDPTMSSTGNYKRAEKRQWSFWTISPPIIAVIVVLSLVGSFIALNVFRKNGLNINHNPKVLINQSIFLDPKNTER